MVLIQFWEHNGHCSHNFIRIFGENADYVFNRMRWYKKFYARYTLLEITVIHPKCVQLNEWHYLFFFLNSYYNCISDSIE